MRRGNAGQPLPLTPSRKGRGNRATAFPLPLREGVRGRGLRDNAAGFTALLLCAAAAPAAEARDFTLVTVGDLIIARPLSQLRHPGAFPAAKGFDDALALLGGADVTYGNMESTIFDSRDFSGSPYSWAGDWMLTSPPSVASDLKSMGIGIVSRANNHALDWGAEGMRQTRYWVQAAGLASAGTGETLDEATAPGFLDTGEGKVAIVSMVSTFRPTTDALPVSPAAPYGRPGVNGLKVSATALVDAANYAKLAVITCSFAGTKPCPPAPASLDLFGTAIRATAPGETPFTYSYAMNKPDLDRNLEAVRQAKSTAPFVIATIHAHEGLAEEAPPATWQDPAGFLKPLAHALIDKGADAFVVTGIHHVAGIEIYRGRPIFYGLGNFFWSDIQEPLSAELYDSITDRRLLAASLAHPERATDDDLGLVLNADSATFAPKGDAARNRTFHTVLVRSTFDRATGNVTAIRLYPIDLGYGDKLSRSGIPRRAGKTIADLVLDRIARLSSGVAITKTEEDGYEIGIAVPR